MQSFKKHIEEAYKASSQKSQFGGHRAHLKNPQGKTSYLGSASYAKPAHAKGEAQAYHDAYHSGPVKNNETGANRAVQAYRAKHKEHMHVKEEVEQLEELTASEKKLINQMYDKKGNLTPMGKKVMDQGKANSELTPKNRDADNARRKEYNAYQKSKRNEEVEQLDELSPNTLSRYAKKADKQADKASDSYSRAAARRSDFASDTPAMAKNAKKFAKRDAGAALAKKKLNATYSESADLDEVTVANSTAAFDLKKKAESYKKTMIAAQQAKGQDAHDKFLKARTSFMTALKKLKQMDLPKAELDALRKGTNISESVDLNESEINDITAQYINENNITVDQLENMTEEELNELIGKAIGGAFKLGAKAAVGATRLAGRAVNRMSTSGRADAAEKKAASVEKKNKDRDRIKAAQDRLRKAKEASRNK